MSARKDRVRRRGAELVQGQCASDPGAVVVRGIWFWPTLREAEAAARGAAPASRVGGVHETMALQLPDPADIRNDPAGDALGVVAGECCCRVLLPHLSPAVIDRLDSVDGSLRLP